MWQAVPRRVNMRRSGCRGARTRRTPERIPAAAPIATLTTWPSPRLRAQRSRTC